MSWNGSDQTSNAAREGTCRTDTRCAPASGAQSPRRAPASGAQPRRAVASSRRPYLRGTLAGLVVVALLGAVAWWFFGGRGATRPTTPTPTPTHPALIEAVAPAATNVPAPPVEPPRELTPDERRLQKLKYYEDKYGTNIPRNLRAVVYYLRRPPKINMVGKSSFTYFRHGCERQIASFLSVQPGTSFLDKPEFGESFNQEFVNALIDKIEILPEDSDEVKAMKQDVEAAKREIAEACKNEGKKPNELMNEYGASLYELGKCREQIMEEISNAHDDENLSDADVQDFYRAANVILKEKGLRELSVPSLKGRSRQLLRQRQKREAKERQKTSQANQ